MKEKIFYQMSAYLAIIAGVFALLYAYFFVIAKDVTLYSLSLLILGLVSLEIVVALYGRLKSVHEGIARLALILGVAGAIGMAIHGGYDLANAINPPGAMNNNLPSQIDPRGLLTFAFMGLGIIKFSWLMSKDRSFSKGLSWAGYTTGTLLLIIYVARLTVLSPTNPVLLYPVLVNGFIINPLWYFWLGYSLFRKS